MENIGNIVIYKDLSVMSVCIVSGSCTSIEEVIPLDSFVWHKNKEDFPYDFEHLTLDEIYQQYVQRTGRQGVILTVFVEDPLYGYVYQCGNYVVGQWVEKGKLIGYA